MNYLIIFISGPPLDWKALKDLQNEVCYPCGLQTGHDDMETDFIIRWIIYDLENYLEKGVM